MLGTKTLIDLLRVISGVLAGVVMLWFTQYILPLDGRMTSLELEFKLKIGILEEKFRHYESTNSALARDNERLKRELLFYEGGY